MSSGDYFERQAWAGQPLTEAFVVDAHGHLGDKPGFPFPDSSPGALVQQMDRIGVRMACLTAIPAIYGYPRRGNDLVLEAMRAFPDRFFGYVMVGVGYPEGIREEMERCLAAGMKGVKLHIRSGLLYNHSNYDPVYEMAEARGLPLLAHTWGKRVLWQLEPQFTRCPHVNFLLGHAGAVERELYASLAKQYGNVYLEICCSACPRGLVEYFVGEGLAQKILWGSDAIFMDSAQQIGRVLFAKISEEEKRLILGENAARVLGL